MPAHSTALANKLSRVFDAQEIEATCAHYTYPLPVQVAGIFRIFQNPRELRCAFDAFCRRCEADGLANPTARIAATELPRHGRFRIWLDWTFTEIATQRVVNNRTIYYCSQIGHRAAIDMIACTEDIAHDPSAVALRLQTA